MKSIKEGSLPEIEGVGSMIAAASYVAWVFM
jgi:hypothetical protein